MSSCRDTGGVGSGFGVGVLEGSALVGVVGFAGGFGVGGLHSRGRGGVDGQRTDTGPVVGIVEDTGVGSSSTGRISRRSSSRTSGVTLGSSFCCTSHGSTWTRFGSLTSDTTSGARYPTDTCSGSTWKTRTPLTGPWVNSPRTGNRRCT